MAQEPRHLTGSVRVSYCGLCEKPNEINYFVSTPWDPQEAVKSRLAPYRGAMRSEPSRRMHSPLSMGFSQMGTASAAYSPGSPRGEGKGRGAGGDFCAS